MTSAWSCLFFFPDGTIRNGFRAPAERFSHPHVVREGLPRNLGYLRKSIPERAPFTLLGDIETFYTLERELGTVAPGGPGEPDYEDKWADLYGDEAEDDGEDDSAEDDSAENSDSAADAN
jgi:hypothetical protein